MSKSPNFKEQLSYEAQGASDFLTHGKTRKDCPHEKESWEWHHWVYGNENAAGEAEIIKRGTISFFSETSTEPLFTLPVKEAIDKAHLGEGPTLIEAITYRRTMHTTADDRTKYRDPAEVKYWEERDPIKRFREYLERNGYWNEELEHKTAERATQEIEKAIEEAESMKLDKPEDIFMYTYSKMPPHLVEQMNELMEYLKNKQ